MSVYLRWVNINVQILYLNSLQRLLSVLKFTITLQMNAPLYFWKAMTFYVKALRVMLLVFNNYVFVEFGGLFTKDLEIMLILVLTH